MKLNLLVLLLLISACSSTSEKSIDGCDYLETISFTGNGPVTTLTHKGNCKNHSLRDSTQVDTARTK